jgi:hypothetical protein
VLIPLVLALPAQAGDGVREINQSRALAGGITSCDLPGFPVQICEPGSYRLTSNLQFPSATAGAIEIQVFDVTLDLNGMLIDGDHACTTGLKGWVESCSPGTGFGGVTGGARVSVMNGRIIGAGGTGLNLGDAADVRNVQVSDCAGDGIDLGPRSQAHDVSSIGNGRTGVTAEESELRGVYAGNNRFEGLYVVGSSVRDAVARQNGSRGLFLEQSSVGGFVSSLNGFSGAFAGDGSIVDGGVIRDNGRSDPGFCGLNGGGGAGYHAIVITSFDGGNPATACGMVNLGANSCQGGACPP